MAGVCEYAMSLPQKMPNFICDQDASRFWGKDKVPFDLVTASIRYEDGRESYTDIKVNGRDATNDISKSPGLWSTGEFGSNLRSIFDSGNLAQFQFARESKWKDHDAWVFTYAIARQNNPLWRLRTGTQILAPPYKGELWVDQKNGDLLRFGSVALDIPKTFGIEDALMQIDYADVSFADGSSFVLPADFTVISTLRGSRSTRNLVQFRNCHKFRAKSRMVLNVPAAVRDGETADDTKIVEAEREREREENEQIYGILRQQAVREDEAQLEYQSAGQTMQAANAALNRLAALHKQAEESAAAAAIAAEKLEAPPPAATTAGLTTLKVSVRLVPVSVVLRDSKGHAIGTLKKEDFQLFDNGKPQAISSFSVEKSAGTAEAASDEMKRPTGSVGAFSARTSVAAPTRNVAYVFDDIHSDVGDLAQARAAAVRHIAALGAEDRAAVFSTSGDIATGFTANHEILEQALQRIRQHSVFHGSQCPPVSEYEADQIVNHGDLRTLDAVAQDALNCAYGGMASKSDLGRAEQLARTAAIEVINVTSAGNQNTLNVLHEVLRRTAATPGARSIVLVSPGLLALTPETRQSVMELVDRAVRANIIVHSLDLHGLATPGFSPAVSHPTDSAWRSGLNRDQALAQSDVLAELAYGTGGEFFHNNNDVNEGFRRTADAPEYIYVLGFSPQKLDGRFHKLKVTVRGSTPLSVQARQGYDAIRPATSQQ